METLIFKTLVNLIRSFPGGSVVKNPPISAGEAGSVPGSEKHPAEGNGNPLQYSCLANLMDKRT